MEKSENKIGYTNSKPAFYTNGKTSQLARRRIEYEQLLSKGDNADILSRDGAYEKLAGIDAKPAPKEPAKENDGSIDALV